MVIIRAYEERKWGTINYQAWSFSSEASSLKTCAPRMPLVSRSVLSTEQVKRVELMLLLSHLSRVRLCATPETASSTEPSMQLCVRGGSLACRCKYKKLQVGDLSWELLLGWDGSRWECPGRLLSWVCTLFAPLWSSSLCTSSPWAPMLIDSFSMQLLISYVIPC